MGNDSVVGLHHTGTYFAIVESDGGVRGGHGGRESGISERL